MPSIPIHMQISEHIDLWEETMKEEEQGMSLELVPLDPLYGIDFRSVKLGE